MIEQSCVICGITVSGPHVTCSSICRAELKSNKSRRHDARRNERMKIDEDYRLRRKEIVRQSAIRNGRTKTEDQREIERLVRLAKAEEKSDQKKLRLERRIWRLSHPEEVRAEKISKEKARLNSDPEYAAKTRAGTREYYHRHKSDINAKRRLNRIQESAAITVLEANQQERPFVASETKPRGRKNLGKTNKEFLEYLKQWREKRKINNPEAHERYLEKGRLRYKNKTKEEKLKDAERKRQQYKNNPRPKQHLTDEQRSRYNATQRLRFALDDELRLSTLERERVARSINRETRLAIRRKREQERRAALIVVRELSLTGD